MADAAAMEEHKRRVLAWAEGFAKATGLELSVALTRDEPESITVSFGGPDARLLAARRGEVLDAMQLVVTLSKLGRGLPRLHLLFDADSYRARREQMLTQMAREVAEEVLATGQEAELDPLTPLERRIIHHVLLEYPGVRTYSEGEDPHRYIVIAPAE